MILEFFSPSVPRFFLYWSHVLPSKYMWILWSRQDEIFANCVLSKTEGKKINVQDLPKYNLSKNNSYITSLLFITTTGIRCCYHLKFIHVLWEKNKFGEHENLTLIAFGFHALWVILRVRYIYPLEHGNLRLEYLSF